MKEAVFLAGLFFEFDISRDKKFLFKYFRSPLENQFVKYYFCFNGEIENFIDHTGFFCQKRWVRILKRRMEKILIFHEKLKNDCLTNESLFSTLTELEKGRYKI